MIDVSKERPETLRQLAIILERNHGVSRTCRTLLKWVKRGCRVAGQHWHSGGDKRIKLEAVLIGGIYHSSVEAYERLIAACSNGDAE